MGGRQMIRPHTARILVLVLVLTASAMIPATGSVAAEQPPTISSVTPSHLAQGTEVDLTLQGTAFAVPFKLAVSGKGVQASVDGVRPNIVTARVTTSLTASPGRRNLIVTDPYGSVTCTGCLIVTAPSPWSIEPSPNPMGVTQNELFGVSCPSAGYCMAVGGGGAAGPPIAESWNGKSWTVEPTPSGGLSSVWCKAQSMCVGVGASAVGGGVSPLAESWNGTSWTVEPTAASSGSFSGVSCISATACTAVGSSPNQGNRIRSRWPSSGMEQRGLSNQPPIPPGVSSMASVVSHARLRTRA